ncbi:MAG: FAD-dependent thymidylate synthase [Candidatus Latescibacterota bacterium]|nr:MAG: FAD-dependent thymidylate synthase [Candidatus Latescibacterota bacterium]
MSEDTTKAPEAEQLVRPSVPALDKVLGVKFDVLDDGFVRLVDYMGSDAAIVQAARVSYGKGTKKTSQDRGLIRYLLRHRHTTPFEMCEIKLHVRVPMDCWRQWIRHRTANVNEYSTRYSIAIDAAQQTEPSQWRRQAPGNKQGSKGFIDPGDGELLSKREREIQDASREVYQERLDAGVSREQARKDLPLATYTEAYWKIDLHNLLHFLSLRMDDHAQMEIREYAKLIGYEIVSQWCPIVWEAFLDYNMEKLVLSRLEIDIVGAIGRGDKQRAIEMATGFGWLKRGEKGLLRHRERNEFEQKLKQLNLPIPWKE